MQPTNRLLIAGALVATLFCAASHAQIGLFPKWGLTRLPDWSPGGTLTIGDLTSTPEAITFTFAYDANVGARIDAIGHRGIRPDGTDARWTYPAAPPAGEPAGFWKALLRPLDSSEPFDVTPDSATGFEIWVDSLLDPTRALFCWSGLTIPGRNPEHRFTMEVRIEISPSSPQRAQWDSRMIRLAGPGNEEFTIDEVTVPIVYAQQPAAIAGLARILVPTTTTLDIPGPNLTMALWDALGLSDRLQHPARGQQMQFSALYSCDSTEVPLPGGEVLSPFGKILYFGTEDAEGHFKRFEHSVVRDPATQLLSYRWAPVYFPAYGLNKHLNVFVSPYSAVMCALRAENDAFWFDVTSHYREFVRDELDLTPIRDPDYRLNPDFVRGSVFLPTTNLPAFYTDYDDIFRTYVDAATDVQDVFVDPGSGAASPVFLEFQKWLVGNASVGESPFGLNPVPYTGVPDTFREPPQAVIDQTARAYANGINVSVFTGPLSVDNSAWTSFPESWFLYTRLGNKIPTQFGHVTDLGRFAVPFWFENVFYDDIMEANPELGGFYLDVLGGLGSVLRFPPPGRNPFAGFQYNGGTRYVKGGQRLMDRIRARVGRNKATNQHPDVPFVITEAVQEYYAGRYDFAQQGIKPIPLHTQLSTILDQLSGVFVPAPVGSSTPNPPLWNSVYHEFSRAEQIGMMLSTRAVASVLGGGQDFDPTNPAVTGLTWDQWGDYNRMVHGLLFAQGMKPTIFPYFYDARDDALLVRDSGTGEVDVRDPSVPQQSQLVAFLQRLHESTARDAEAGQFLNSGVAARPLALPPLPVSGYDPAVVSTVFNPSVETVLRTDPIGGVTRYLYEDTFSSFPFSVAAVFHSVWRVDAESDELGIVFVNWTDQPANWSGELVPSLYEGMSDDFVIKGLRPAGGGVTEFVVGTGSGTTDLVWNASPPPGALQLQHHGGGAGAMPPRSVQVFIVEPN